MTETPQSPHLPILLLNGPNLNTLGTRQPEVYGTDTLADVVELAERTAAELGFGVRALQTNHEGEMIDAIHEAVGKISGIVINPAGWTHTSVALADALVIPDVPIMEVHISNAQTGEVPAAFVCVADRVGHRRRLRHPRLRVRGQTPGRARRLAGSAAPVQVRGAWPSSSAGTRRLRSLIVPAPTVRRAKLLAIVTGLLGLVLALATPLMPVKQTSAEIDWPAQTGPVTSVSAPLTAYVPVTMSATIPCAAIDHLGPDGTVLLSTTPKDAEKSAQRGLIVRKTGSSNGTSVEVVIRNVPIVAATVAQMRARIAAPSPSGPPPTRSAPSSSA